MDQKLIIGISIGIVVVLVIGVHGYLHRLLKFKMDESAILKLLQISDRNTAMSTERISTDTNLTVERVAVICYKSKVIQPDANVKDAWFLNG